MPLLVEERFQLGVLKIGYIFTLMALISALVQGIFLFRIVKVFGKKGTIFWGMLVQEAGLALAAVLTNFSFFVASFMMTSLGSALNRPTAEGIISRLKKSEQGTILGVGQFL